MPELLLAALAGTGLVFASRRGKFRALRAPLCGALAGCGLIFTWGILTYRYLHDLFPWLVAASAIAAVSIPTVRRKWLRYGLSGLFAVLTLYATWTNFAFAIVQQRVVAHPVPLEKSLSFLDAVSAINGDGLAGFVTYAAHWRRYVPAASYEHGNLIVEGGEVVSTQGQPPYGAEYVFEVPADGTYELAIRYASAEMRPFELYVNGTRTGEVYGAATGGWSEADQRWVSSGRLYRLRGGSNRIGLASSGKFPFLTMLRLVRRS
jgi:hypothetical protein